jgi:hypothetical protein
VSSQTNPTTRAGSRRALRDHVAPHRVTDEDEPFETELLDDGRDIVAERLYRPLLASKARFTVPCKIDRDDLEILGELFQLCCPIASITGPTVDEHECWRSLAMHFIGNANTVGRSDELSLVPCAFGIDHFPPGSGQ